jgi:hypothetical protein
MAETSAPRTHRFAARGKGPRRTVSADRRVMGAKPA